MIWHIFSHIFPGIFPSKFPGFLTNSGSEESEPSERPEIDLSPEDVVPWWIL